MGLNPKLLDIIGDSRLLNFWKFSKRWPYILSFVKMSSSVG